MLIALYYPEWTYLHVQLTKFKKTVQFLTYVPVSVLCISQRGYGPGAWSHPVPYLAAVGVSTTAI